MFIILIFIEDKARAGGICIRGKKCYETHSEG
jgi:hypothetical protein